LYVSNKDESYAKKAWAGVRIPQMGSRRVEGPEVLLPIDDVPGLSTNSVAQGCLEAIEVLQMTGGAGL